MSEDKHELKKVTIFTDGACIGSPGPGGYGVLLQYGIYSKELSDGFRLTTNNRMELIAAIVGLEALKTKCHVTLYTDSQLLVNGISEGWAEKWRKNGWKRGKDYVLNADLWKRLLELCEMHEIEVIWVKGHAGIPGNEKANSLSMQAAQYKSSGVDTAYEESETQLTQPTLFKTAKAQTTLQSTIVELNNTSYTWTGSSWYETKTFLKPPQVIIHSLNQLLSELLSEDDAKTSDVHILIEKASKAREALQFNRAERLARSILNLEPENHAGLAILCASLRARGFARQAIDETDPYRHTSNSALLTSRAAAFCDLKMWEEAKRTIARSLAIQQSEEAFNVVKRIKSERPDLYR